jgi:hypothetical protein
VQRQAGGVHYLPYPLLRSGGLLLLLLLLLGQVKLLHKTCWYRQQQQQQLVLLAVPSRTRTCSCAQKTLSGPLRHRHQHWTLLDGRHSLARHTWG